MDIIRFPFLGLPFNTYPFCTSVMSTVGLHILD